MDASFLMKWRPPLKTEIKLIQKSSINVTCQCAWIWLAKPTWYVVRMHAKPNPFISG